MKNFLVVSICVLAALASMSGKTAADYAHDMEPAIYRTPCCFIGDLEYLMSLLMGEIQPAKQAATNWIRNTIQRCEARSRVPVTQDTTGDVKLSTTTPQSPKKTHRSSIIPGGILNEYVWRQVKERIAGNTLHYFVLGGCNVGSFSWLFQKLIDGSDGVKDEAFDAIMRGIIRCKAGKISPNEFPHCGMDEPEQWNTFFKWMFNGYFRPSKALQKLEAKLASQRRVMDTMLMPDTGMDA